MPQMHSPTITQIRSAVRYAPRPRSPFRIAHWLIGATVVAMAVVVGVGVFLASRGK